MLREILLVPLSLEWTILITVLTPRLLSSTPWSNKRPGLAIGLWLVLLGSALLSAAVAVVSAVISVFATWFSLNSQVLGSKGWLVTLGLSFAPWLFLALAGISLALLGQVVEPHVEKAKNQKSLLDSGVRATSYFDGVGVCELVLPIPMAFTAKVQGKRVIIVSTAAREILSPKQIQAVLWHEIGHIRLHHASIQRLSRFLLLVSPWLAISKLFVEQVNHLCELQADNFAAGRVGAEVVESARSLFSFQ